MKPYENIKLAYQYLTTQFNGYSTMQWLETQLKNLITPDIEGVPLNSIADHNITHDGNGNVVIGASEAGDTFTLKGETTDLILHWNEDDAWFERSIDGGENFSPVLSLDMMDPIPDEAESLNDGQGNVVTAAEVRQHIDNVAIHVGGFLSEGGYVKNMFLALSGMSQARQLFYDGWGDSFITNDSIDPASTGYFIEAGKIKNIGELTVWEYEEATYGSYSQDGGVGSAIIRVKIPNALLLGGGSQVAAKVHPGAYMPELWIGHKGEPGTHDFDGNQVQMLQGAGALIDGSVADAWTDFVAFTLDENSDLLFSFSTDGQYRQRYNAAMPYSIRSKTGINVNDTNITGGNLLETRIANILVLKVLSTGIAVLLFLPYNAPSAPAAGRCLLHINDIGGITPGTDLKVYQAADEAAPVWEEFSTIESTTLSDDTLLLDMQANFAESGTTPQLKIETPTGKEVEILAVKHLVTI